MNRNFSQMISVRSDDLPRILELVAEWDYNQATGDIMGYMGCRVLADRANEGDYVLIADFGVVDPNVSAADEASKNNDRPETLEWVERFRKVIEGEPVYHDYDEVYRTDQ